MFSHRFTTAISIGEMKMANPTVFESSLRQIVNTEGKEIIFDPVRLRAAMKDLGIRVRDIKLTWLITNDYKDDFKKCLNGGDAEIHMVSETIHDECSVPESEIFKKITLLRDIVNDSTNGKQSSSEMPNNAETSDIEGDCQILDDEIRSKGKCGKELEWIVTKDRKLIITGSGQMDDYLDPDDANSPKEKTAPWKEYSIKTISLSRGLTNIGDYAFYRCKMVSTISIPESVETIGAYAFYKCRSLESIDIGPNVTEIKDFAFGKCTSLANIAISDSVETIGNQAFYGCYGLIEIVIPDSVETIGNQAFYGCSELTKASIGRSVETIGNQAFYGCSKLVKVSIGRSVETIGNQAFYGCRNVVSITVPLSIETIGKDAFDSHIIIYLPKEAPVSSPIGGKYIHRY